MSVAVYAPADEYVCDTSLPELDAPSPNAQLYVALLCAVDADASKLQVRAEQLAATRATGGAGAGLEPVPFQVMLSYDAAHD